MKTTFRGKVIYGTFIGICCSWMLIVLDRTAMWDAWKAWGLAFLGAALIAFIGLRLVTILDTRWSIREMNRRPRIAVCNGNNPLEACQMGHRQPYFSPRVN